MSGFRPRSTPAWPRSLTDVTLVPSLDPPSTCCDGLSTWQRSTRTASAERRLPRIRLGQLPTACSTGRHAVTGVGVDAENPAVHAEHELVEGLRVAAGEEQHDAGEEDEQADEASGAPHPIVTEACPRRPVAAGKDRDDEVVRQGEQPPLDEHEPAGERLRIVDLEPRRVVGDVLETEGRVLIGAKCAVAVEADAP